MFNLILSILNNGLFISYIKSRSFDLPLSAKEEQFYLIKKMEGDKAARDILIEKNLRLVAHIAKKYENNRDLQEDLISIGTIGLIKAVDSFQPTKQTRLATYASRCIENEILMHLRSSKKLNQEVSMNEVVGVDKDGSEIVLEDLLEKKEMPYIDQIDQKDKINKLITHFDILSSREKEIIVKRYGLNNTKKMTQKEIAEELNISRSYVSRIEKRALIKLLRIYLEKNGSLS